MRGDAGHAQRHHGRVTELQKFQRVTRVFLARSLMVHGEDAPGVLRQMADELEWLEEDAQREEQERVALRALSPEFMGSGALAPCEENRRLRARALRE